MTNRHKRCSTSLIIKRNAYQNYSEVQPYIGPGQNDHFKSLQVTNAGENVEK